MNRKQLEERIQYTKKRLMFCGLEGKEEIKTYLSGRLSVYYELLMPLVIDDTAKKIREVLA